MACADCSETEDLKKVKVGRKTIKLCEDCADIRRENAEIAGDAQSAMMDMMEWKGS